MSRLVSPDLFELRETTALRDRRNRLLREVERRRYRLHYVPHLLTELQQVTCDLMRQELSNSQPPKKPQPLGDAGTVGNAARAFDFYKD